MGAAQNRWWETKCRELAFIVYLLYALKSVWLSIHNICTESVLSAGQPGEGREGHVTYPWPCTAGSGVGLGPVSRSFCFLSPGLTFLRYPPVS